MYTNASILDSACYQLVYKYLYCDKIPMRFWLCSIISLASESNEVVYLLVYVSP